MPTLTAAIFFTLAAIIALGLLTRVLQGFVEAVAVIGGGM